MVRQNRRRIYAGSLISSIAIIIAGLGLAGCNQYFDRQDPITLGAGDAIAQNKVTHAVTPWPAGAEDPRHTTSGARALIAVRKYEKNQSKEPKSIRTNKKK